MIGVMGRVLTMIPSNKEQNALEILVGMAFNLKYIYNWQ